MQLLQPLCLGIYALALGCRRWGMLATYRYIVTGCLTVLLTSRAFPGAISDSSSPRLCCDMALRLPSDDPQSVVARTVTRLPHDA
ncbi:MAG: hypothetical protein IPL14_18080 [Nitrospira sp.]|nr:hypothetical protein [Nitrospira sp.]